MKNLIFIIFILITQFCISQNTVNANIEYNFPFISKGFFSGYEIYPIGSTYILEAYKSDFNLNIEINKNIISNNLFIGCSFQYGYLHFGKETHKELVYKFYRPRFNIYYCIFINDNFSILPQLGFGYSTIRIRNLSYNYNKNQFGINYNGKLSFCFNINKNIDCLFYYSYDYIYLDKDDDFTRLNSLRKASYSFIGTGVKLKFNIH